MRKLLILILINSAIGAWLATTSVVQFSLFLKGISIHEPNNTISTIELVLSSLFAIWFIVVSPLLFSKVLGKEVMLTKKHN